MIGMVVSTGNISQFTHKIYGCFAFVRAVIAGHNIHNIHNIYYIVLFSSHT